MSSHSLSDESSYSNTINGQSITLIQGENAVNFFISKEIYENTRPKSLVNGNKELAAPKGKPKNLTDKSPDNTIEENARNQDIEDNVTRLHKLKSAMAEIAQIQLRPTSQVETLTYIAVNYIKLGDDEGYSNTMKMVDNHLASMASVSSILLLISEYIQSKKEFEAIIMCRSIVSWWNMNERHQNPQKCLENMVKFAMTKTRDAAKQMFEQKDSEKEVFYKYVPPIMYDMYLHCSEVVDVESHFKVEMSALACYYISCVHFFFKQYKEMYEISSTALADLTEARGSSAIRFTAYGDIILMAALAKYLMDELDEAESLWQKAVDSYQTETDEESQSSVRLASEWIAVVRRRRLETPTQSVNASKCI